VPVSIPETRQYGLNEYAVIAYQRQSFQWIGWVWWGSQRSDDLRPVVLYIFADGVIYQRFGPDPYPIALKAQA
jgi:hypothetical protein